MFAWFVRKQSDITVCKWVSVHVFVNLHLSCLKYWANTNLIIALHNCIMRVRLIACTLIIYFSWCYENHLHNIVLYYLAIDKPHVMLYCKDDCSISVFCWRCIFFYWTFYVWKFQTFEFSKYTGAGSDNRGDLILWQVVWIFWWITNDHINISMAF